jgi:hypothetical protein
MSDLIQPGETEGDGNNSIVNLDAGMTADHRVKVTVVLHEDFSRPNLSLQIFDRDDHQLARSFIINIIDRQTDFTLHLRQPHLNYPLRLRCETFKIDDTVLDFKEIFLES